eukprot:Colp12_sorted_trinity150504_noHs@30108
MSSPRRTSEMPNPRVRSQSTVSTSDEQLYSELEVLREKFQEVLTRNAFLEREVDRLTNVTLAETAVSDPLPIVHSYSTCSRSLGDAPSIRAVTSNEHDNDMICKKSVESLSKPRISEEGNDDPTGILRKKATQQYQSADELSRNRSTSLTPIDKEEEDEDTHKGERTIKAMREGFTRFREKFLMRDPEHFKKLSVGQSPTVLLIACCDSRVDPGVITGASPGDIFVVRNVANLVPPYEAYGHSSRHGTMAAIEYAVNQLKVQDIIVLGHRKCGGIMALLTRDRTQKADDYVSEWMSIAYPARDRTLYEVGHEPLDVQARFCEQESINISLTNLMTFPWIKELVSRKRLKLHGWYFDIEAGDMYSWTLRYEITGLEKF